MVRLLTLGVFMEKAKLLLFQILIGDLKDQLQEEEFYLIKVFI